MPVIKRELHRTTKGSVLSDEGWWYLAHDTDSDRVFVLHEWVRGEPDRRTAEIELSPFLGEDGPAQRELRRLIATLVEAEDIPSHPRS